MTAASVEAFEEFFEHLTVAGDVFALEHFQRAVIRDYFGYGTGDLAGLEAAA